MALSSRTRDAPLRGHLARSSSTYDSLSTEDHDRVIPMPPPISRTPSSTPPSLPRPMSDTEGSLTPIQHEREIGVWFIVSNNRDMTYSSPLARLLW